MALTVGPPEQPGDAGSWKMEEDILLHHFADGSGANVLMVHGGPGYPPSVPWPVLVIHGADDLQPEAASRRYSELFPNATFHVVPDATHFPFRDQPEEFAKVVGEFLRAARSAR